MICENSIKTYTLPYVKQIASGSLMCNSGHPRSVLCDNLEGWGGEEGFQEGGDMCIPMANLYCDMAKTIIIL